MLFVYEDKKYVGKRCQSPAMSKDAMINLCNKPIFASVWTSIPEKCHVVWGKIEFRIAVDGRSNLITAPELAQRGKDGKAKMRWRKNDVTRKLARAENADPAVRRVAAVR